tara:strand:+ start:67 stop:729 length:663 start_codon:yes stop_codon:yes gene_type:complete
MALTKFNFNSFDLTTAANKGLAFNSSANGFETSSPGSMTLIKTIDASSDSNIQFIHGSSSVVFDSTYPVYLFKFYNLHPGTDDRVFEAAFRDGGSSFDASVITNTFYAQHAESDSPSATLGYIAGRDFVGTGDFNLFSSGCGNANDESLVGELYVFNPSSTTFVKQFISRGISNNHNAYVVEAQIAGYANTATAIDGVRFQFDSGNIDTGQIKLYGIKDS